MVTWSATGPAVVSPHNLGCLYGAVVRLLALLWYTPSTSPASTEFSFLTAAACCASDKSCWNDTRQTFNKPRQFCTKAHVTAHVYVLFQAQSPLLLLFKIEVDELTERDLLKVSNMPLCTHFRIHRLRKHSFNTCSTNCCIKNPVIRLET